MQNRQQGATEIVTYDADFARVLEATWQPGTEYEVGDYVRPPFPNGAEYECTIKGQSDSQEPDWPRAADATIVDGIELTWKALTFGTNATDTISSISVTAETGVSVDSSGYAGTVVSFTISGGTVGKSYDISILVTTAAGDKYRETLRLAITE